MRITQVYNGHADPKLYDVIMIFQIDGKEYGAHFTFDRVAKTTIAVYFFEDVADDETRDIPQPAGVVLDELETAAREYFGKAA
jgi:hypothetical protein